MSFRRKSEKWFQMHVKAFQDVSDEFWRCLRAFRRFQKGFRELHRLLLSFSGASGWFQIRLKEFQNILRNLKRFQSSFRGGYSGELQRDIRGDSEAFQSL